MRNCTWTAIDFVSSVRIILTLSVPRALIVLPLQHCFFMVQFILVGTSTSNKTRAKWFRYIGTSSKRSFKRVLETLKLLLIAPGVSLGNIHSTSKRKFKIGYLSLSISNPSSKSLTLLELQIKPIS